eukprot:jgi/Hompol1/4109/HPOL_006926-RA
MLNDPLQSDIEGLLISDASDEASFESSHIVVTSFAVVHPEDRFYDAAGQIDDAKLQRSIESTGQPAQ